MEGQRPTACAGGIRFASLADCRMGRSSSDESESLRLLCECEGPVIDWGEVGYVFASFCHPLKASPLIESPARDESMPAVEV